MNNLPTTTTAETLDISPEALEVANCYLQTQDVLKVAEELDISKELVVQYLDRKEVKAYIDHVFFNIGFNNRFKMRKLMDTVILKKLEELEESGMGSTKDIADLMALSHKMTMEELDRQIALEKIRVGEGVKNQVNVQINEGFSDGTKYGALMQRLLSGE